MKKNIPILCSLLFVLSLFITSCTADEKKAAAIRPEPTSLSFTEEFNDVSALANKGWVILNNSDPGGITGWRQGKYEVVIDPTGGQVLTGFPAFSAQKAPTDFVSVDLTAGSNNAILSCWLITPPITIKNGDTLSFYTRSKGKLPDRLQVRANLTNQSTNIGSNATTVGDFTTLWLEINPGLTATGYSTSWLKYTIPINNLPSGVLISARIAFRYFVTDGGPNGFNSDMIGIDQLKFVSK